MIMGRKKTIRNENACGRSRELTRRSLHFLGSSLAGFCAGIAGDFLQPLVRFSIEDVVHALLLAPFVMTFGGGFNSIPWGEAKLGFALGGLLFLPGYVVLLV